jgi:hypothetical protein
MSEQISLREFERKAYSTIFQDGLLDIVIGCGVVQFSVAPLLTETGLNDFWSSAVFVPIMFGLIAVAWMVRRKVVVPRLGQLRVGAWRKRKLSRGVIGLLALNVLIFVLGVLAAVGSISSRNVLSWIPIPHIGFGLSTLMLFSVSAAIFEVPRFYLYGALLALSPVVGEWLHITIGASHHGFPVTFGAVAVIIILIGVTLFVRLLRRYPTSGEQLVEVETSDE